MPSAIDNIYMEQFCIVYAFQPQGQLHMFLDRFEYLCTKTGPFQMSQHASKEEGKGKGVIWVLHGVSGGMRVVVV